MRHSIKELCHSATFIINDQKSHIIRTEIHCQGKHIGLQNFRLTGTSCSCNQAMRPMVLLMHIQKAVCSARFLSNQHFHTSVGSVFLPTFFNMQILQFGNSVHFHESNLLRNLTSNFNFSDFCICLSSCHLLQILTAYFIKDNWRSFSRSYIIAATELPVILNNTLTAVRQIFTLFGKQYHCKSQICFLIINIVCKKFSVQIFLLLHKQNIVWPAKFSLFFRIFLLFPTHTQNLGQLIKNLTGTVFV